MTATQAELSTPFTSLSGQITKTQRLAGRFLSGFATLFLLLDGTAKVLQLEPVLEGARQLGYPTDTVFTLGVVLLACLALYVIPWTAGLGALLLTGYLGGAVATHVRVASPLLSHVLFPIYVAALLWGGLVLRNPSLRAIVPNWRRA
jgi:hypothetical protein